MTQLKVLLAFIAISLILVDAKPLDDNGGAEIVMKIEKINEQLPGVQAKLNGDDTSKNDAKPRKQQRNYPVYYVTSKVNGKFGKSVRAFTSQEFLDKYPVKY